MARPQPHLPEALSADSVAAPPISSRSGPLHPWMPRDYISGMMDPADRATDVAGLNRLADLLHGRRTVVLAGAGCSTESGIPDYRGLTQRASVRRPIRYQEFVRDEVARARYWARSTIGWPRFSASRPNPAHRALAALEGAGLAAGIITQNVDGLHQAAGSRRVVELHGSLGTVRCLSCGDAVGRDAHQERLTALNAAWLERLRELTGTVESAPDGDVDLPGWTLESFRVPSCRACGGILKPDVVFFGENVPRERVEDAWRLLGRGELLLVVGTSLEVYSGRRFVLGAAENALPIVIVNLGPTRADDMATAKLDARLGDTLPRLVETLRERNSGRAAPRSSEALARPLARPGTQR